MKNLLKITFLTVTLISAGFANAQITETPTPTTDRLSNTAYDNNDNDDDSGKLGLIGLIGLLGLLGLRRNRTRDELNQNRNAAANR